MGPLGGIRSEGLARWLDGVGLGLDWGWVGLGRVGLGWLVGWLVGWLAGWFVGWLVVLGWFID